MVAHIMSGQVPLPVSLFSWHWVRNRSIDKEEWQLYQRHVLDHELEHTRKLFESWARALFYREICQKPTPISIDSLAKSLDFDSGSNRNFALKNVRGSRSIGRASDLGSHLLSNLSVCFFAYSRLATLMSDLTSWFLACLNGDCAIFYQCSKELRSRVEVFRICMSYTLTHGQYQQVTSHMHSR